MIASALTERGTNMRSRLLFFIFLPLLLISCSQKQELFTLVDSQTPCTIVLDLGDYATVQDADNAYRSIDWFDNKHKQDNVSQTALAALELQHYLSTILNIPTSFLKIVDDSQAPGSGSLIILGLPPASGLKKFIKPVKRSWRKAKSTSAQALRIDSFYSKEQRGLILSGKTATGTLYAVYELLTRYGVRWFAPEKDSEFVPRMHKIDIFSIHNLVDPELKIRGYWIDDRRSPNQGNAELYQWLGRNRINLFWNHESDVAALKQRGVYLNTGRQDVINTLLKPEYNYRYNHPNVSDDDQYPMDPYIVSDSFRGDQNGDKKISYGEAHPEWFDMEMDSTSNEAAIATPHFCLSQPDAINEFSQIIVDKLLYGEWQTSDIIDLWQPDQWCSCEKCQQMGNDADKLLFVMYQVNKAVQAAMKNGRIARPIFVHGYIRTFAAEPPSVKLPKDFAGKNMAVYLFTGPRCYNHYIISPGCTDINIWFSRSLLEWRNEESKYQGDLYIAENYNADYIHNLPATHSEMMRLDIPAYVELGVTGINFQHMRIHDRGVQTLLNYQFARETWERDIAVDTLRNEFFAYYYQEAGELVRKYYEQIELAMATISTWGYYMPRRAQELLNLENSANFDGKLLIDERFAMKDSVSGADFSTLWENTYHNIFEARFFMDQVKTLDLSPLILERVAELDKQLDYTELMISLYDNIITYLTSRADERYVQEEAIIRMQENKAKLQAMHIISPLQGATSAYAASGVQKVVDLLNEDFNK